MAKHISKHSEPRRPGKRGVSLESLLEQVRTLPETDEPPVPETETAASEPELSEELPFSDTLPEETADTDELIPETEELLSSLERLENALPDDRYTEDTYAPEEEPAPAIREEGFEEEGDFYAGALPADEEPEPAEEQPEEKTERGKRSRTGLGGGDISLKSLQKKFLSLLSASENRRQKRREQPEPEIEDKDREMEPKKAVRFYAAQMPSLRLRGWGALLVCLLLLWITFSASFGWTLPGQLQSDMRLCAFVVLCGELTVLLIALDITTSGIMSLLRGRPGAEALLTVSALASLLDAVFIAAAGDGSRGLPFCAVPAVAVTCALLGSQHVCQGYRFSFLALHHAGDGFSLTSERIGEGEEKYLIKSRRSAAGFIRRSEEPDVSERLCAQAFLPMTVGSLALALALSVGGGDIKAFFHLFALFMSLCASFGWLLSIPLFFEQVAARLLQNGSAVAGWAGAKDVGAGYRPVITDGDLFPEGTVEITGMRILDKAQADRIVSVAGSLLAACGACTAGVFSELMRRKNAAICALENFEVGAGGASAVADGQTVRIGSLGYMHLSGVKVPDKLKFDSTLYCSVDEELMGLFLFRYRPTQSVRQSLFALRSQHRRPLFAVRDFNLDPLRIRKDFGVSTEGFEFPSVPERFRISAIPEHAESPVSGVMARDGLDTLVELAEGASSLFRRGQLCTWLSLASVILGAAAALLPGWHGNWAAISAGRILLYNLLWLAPTLICLALDK